MFGRFIKYTALCCLGMVWLILVCFLIVAAVPGAVFYADAWVGWFWSSGIAAIIVFSMGCAALGIACES